MSKKKILVSLIVVLVVIILTFFVLIIFNKQQILNKNLFKTADFALLEENDIPKNNFIDVPINESTEESIPEETTKIQEIIETNVNSTSQEIQSSLVKNETTKQDQLQAKQESRTQTQTQSKTETIPPTQNQVEIEQKKTTEKNTEITTPSSSNTPQITKDEGKYIRNDVMINKIKEVIETNESEYMKTYGYNIVVDSSIKELTNQFTYTENRVKQKITWKCGTIRIYAEDYYYNGQYVMTECYII